MPSHQERREPLPAGYQFGDAAEQIVEPLQAQTRRLPEWLRQDDYAIVRDAEIIRHVYGRHVTANVIEGEQH